MPRVKRGRTQPRPPSPSAAAAAAADPGSGRGWLSIRPSRPPRPSEDAGTPLTDKILLVIFAGLPKLADLVRCAFTCRRWRRLVSAEAAFLCRTPRQPCGKFIRPLALGFFHHLGRGAAAPLFVPTASAARRLGLQVPSSLNSLVDGLFDSSRIVASRNGLVVVDLRHSKSDETVELCVCNPMTGEVHILPPVSGKDGVEHFTCTVLTADNLDLDLDGSTTNPMSARSSHFCLLMLYTRHCFTAFRSYSSDAGSWSEEAKVTDRLLREEEMGLTRMGVVNHIGDETFWLAKNVVFVLNHKTMASIEIPMPHLRNAWMFDMANTLLGFLPEGKPCVVQFDALSLTTTERNVTIRVSTLEPKWPGYQSEELFPVDQFLPDDLMKVKLQWFFEKSGVVCFTAVCGSRGDWRSEMYALSLSTYTVEMVASHAGDGDPWKDLHGYEMDQVAYLASLAERDVADM